MLLIECVQGIDGATTEYAKVTGIFRDANFTDALNNAIEKMCCGPFQQGLALAMCALCVYHIIPILPFMDQFRYQLRWVLQVCVNNHNSITGGLMQARSQGNLLAEVTAQINQGYVVVCMLQLPDGGQCVVSAAVVDVDDLCLLYTSDAADDRRGV